MQFFVGVHQPSDAHHFARSFVSVVRLQHRRSDFPVNLWMMDSGAFSQISKHGAFLMGPSEYAYQIERWSSCGTMLAAVAQDWMCEPWILRRTGLTVRDHQYRTIKNYAALLQRTSRPILPVLQGYEPSDYIQHLADYQFPKMAWVGVGSVCKRNTSPKEIRRVMLPLKMARPDLRFHGFGVKLSSLQDDVIRQCFYSCDSMAWSFAARKQGRDGNSWEEAEAFRVRVESEPAKMSLPLWSGNQMTQAQKTRRGNASKSSLARLNAVWGEGGA